MTYLELCPACLRLAHDLVEQALDFTGLVTRGDMQRICGQHLPLVFLTLDYQTMAEWLASMLSLRASDPAASAAMVCLLCQIEAQFAMSDEEKASRYLCPGHGGGDAEVLELIRHHLARITDGERFDQQRFVIRAALMFYLAGRGTAPFVRFE